jgi:hypothetical protein
MKAWFAGVSGLLVCSALLLWALWGNVSNGTGRGAYLAVALALLSAVAASFAFRSNASHRYDQASNVAAAVALVVAVIVACGAGYQLFLYYAFTGGTAPPF